MITRHRIFAVMAALIVLIGLAFGPDSVAQAADTTTTHIIRASLSAYVLDVESAPLSHDVYLFLP
jgi:hypothetical protein